MSAGGSRGLDIVPIWRRLNADLIRLVDAVPEEDLDWAPNAELWSFRQLFAHLAAAREEWMTRAIADGEPNTVRGEAMDAGELKEALRATWDRIERVFRDGERLDATYRDRWWKEAPPYDGHWVAWHLLEHDLHHRAEMLLYMSLLGLPVGNVWTA